jgi:hypothetical protein
MHRTEVGHSLKVPVGARGECQLDGIDASSGAELELLLGKYYGLSRVVPEIIVTVGEGSQRVGSRGDHEVPTARPFENVVIHDLVSGGAVVPDQDDHERIGGFLGRAQGAADPAHGRQLLLLLLHAMEHAIGEQECAKEGRADETALPFPVRHVVSEPEHNAQELAAPGQA